MRLPVLLLLLGVVVDAYKALIYHPLTGHSHMKFMGTLSSILVDEGNDLTMLMPLVDATLRETTPQIRRLKKRIMVETDARVQAIVDGMGGKNMRKRAWSLRPSIHGFIQVGVNISDIYKYTCDNLFSQTELLAQLKAEKFEIGISEPLFICGFALFDYLGIPKTVSVDSHAGLQPVKVAHGDPQAASFVPASFSSSSEKMSLFGRIRNAVETYLSTYFVETIYDKELSIISDRYNRKSWEDLLYDTAVVFVNSNPFLDFPYPHTSKTIHIGGITIDTDHKEKKLLPDEYDEILSRRSSNVLISFGSNARSIDMPIEFKKAMLQVFEQMPDTTFIWKYEDPKSDIISSYNRSIDNVVLTSWMPQMELLGDRRLNLFMTHGGLGSTTELAYRGKPSVMVPVFGDQSRNARMMERHGAAILLKKEDLANPDQIADAIRRIIHDPSYDEKATKLAQILHNQPIPVRDLFTNYMNFAAKFGRSRAFEVEARNLSVIQYYYIDAMALVATSLLSLAFLLYFLVVSLRRTYINKQKVE